MRKGKVIKIEADYAIVLTPEMEYYRLKYKDGLHQGQSIYFFDEDIRTPEDTNFTFKGIEKRKKAQKKLSLSGLAACLVLVFWLTGFFGFFSSQAYYAMVTVDINPSIQLGVDKNYIVLKAEALNNDGMNIVSDDLQGLRLAEAMKLVLAKARQQQYLTAGKDTVLVSAVMNSEYQQEQDEFIRNLNTTLVRHNQTEGYDFIILKSDPESLKKAKAEGLSTGKFKLYEMADGDLTLDQAKTMKVQEMISIPAIKEKLIQKDNYLKLEKEEQKKEGNGKGKDPKNKPNNQTDQKPKENGQERSRLKKEEDSINNYRNDKAENKKPVDKGADQEQGSAKGNPDAQIDDPVQDSRGREKADSSKKPTADSPYGSNKNPEPHGEAGKGEADQIKGSGKDSSSNEVNNGKNQAPPDENESGRSADKQAGGSKASEQSAGKTSKGDSGGGKNKQEG